MPDFRQIWNALEPRGQFTLVAAGLVAVVTLVLLFQFASKPSFATIATGLDPAETSDIQNTLSDAGINFRLAAGGTAVEVQQGQENTARVALADQGLPRSHVGFELFDEKKLGASDFEQRVDYQRALEGEIARTIEEIEDVQAAQVQLVLPDDSLFIDEASPATAAVLLTAGPSLDSSAIAGISQLVASSVESLKANNVTITDGGGRLLWPTQDALSGGASATSKLEAEQRYSARLAAQITSMLTSTLGPDKAQVRVNADLDLNQKRVEKVTFARRGTPITTENETETLTSEGGAPASPSGAAANVPTLAEDATAGGSSDYSRTTTKTTRGVNKTVEETTQVPGKVNRLDVAVLIDSSVPEEQRTSLTTAISGLAGIHADRGDTITVEPVDFAVPEVVEEEPPAASPVAALGNPIDLVKWVALGFGLLIFLFIVRRTMKRRVSEAVTAEPTWLREIQAAVPLAELTAGSGGALDSSQARRAELNAQVEEIASNQPEQIAQQVGAWMNE
ncbi:MAG: flagellar basal-body MS-ring/collar protein FliF [Gaiellaceae bacterium]